VTGRARTILVIEDDRYLRRSEEVMLRRHGDIVVSAEDGEAGLRMARDRLPDLILLDLVMPKIQGFEVLRQLKADPATRDIPVLVLSNLGQERDRQAMLGAGAMEYYVKAEMTLDQLADIVDRALMAHAK
jgi:two-component system phosphate regulon response regulator PhoB